MCLSLYSSPYRIHSQEGVCLDQGIPPAGFISSFSRLASCNERVLQQRLVAEGPVSVGVCGTDLEFLFYKQGIFNLDSCCVEQNHALLIVGYGAYREEGWSMDVDCNIPLVNNEY